MLKKLNAFLCMSLAVAFMAAPAAKADHVYITPGQSYIIHHRRLHAVIPNHYYIAPRVYVTPYHYHHYYRRVW